MTFVIKNLTASYYMGCVRGCQVFRPNLSQAVLFTSKRQAYDTLSEISLGEKSYVVSTKEEYSKFNIQETTKDEEEAV